MTPNLGQGACLAMEDAWALGSIIPNYPDPGTAFEKYQNSRTRRAYSIQVQSRAIGWVVQAETPLALAAREWITPRIPDILVRLGMKGVFAEQVI
jgi:2-polyprenyl-6-methoxyphenol hydroxylase-like FAD-dependent oxidoreductase